MPEERTLILIKPEGMERGLSGEIIRRFEETGLKLVAAKMLQATKEQVSKHYVNDKAWLVSVGEKTIKSYAEKGIKLNETAEERGTKVRNMLMSALISGPILALVFEGNESVFVGRKIAGATEPKKADPSSIRGMYSTDSYALADKKGRPVKTILHASDTPENAETEIKVWFTKGEIYAYKRADEGSVY
jgi:nucleoside-diphosphate kinase